MVYVYARVTGKRVELGDHDRYMITVKGNIDLIYFITPYNVQTIFKVLNEKEVEIAFNGNLLYITDSLCIKGFNKKSSDEKEIIIGGDIVSFDGNVLDEKMRQFRVYAYSVFVEENEKIHWTR